MQYEGSTVTSGPFRGADADFRVNQHPTEHPKRPIKTLQSASGHRVRIGVRKRATEWVVPESNLSITYIIKSSSWPR